MPGSWKRKRILSEGIDFKQLEKYDSWKVAKYSSSKDVWSQLVLEYYNLSYKPIFSKVQRFQYLCRKAETKKCKASMEAAAFSPPLKHLAKLFELFLNSYFWVRSLKLATIKLP